MSLIIGCKTIAKILERRLKMLYTCKDARYNDAKNESELIEYAKKVVEDEFFRQRKINDIDAESNKIVNANTANEALEKYVGEHWYPVTNDQEIRSLIYERLRIRAYDAFNEVLVNNGLYDYALDEKIISENDFTKFADSNIDNVLEQYAELNAGNSSVNRFVDQFVENNGVALAEQTFSFDQYWDQLVIYAIDNLVANGVDVNAAQAFCVPANGQDVQVAAASESDAEPIADQIIENKE